MGAFDAADARAAAAVGRAFEESVQWVPMRQRATGRYTNSGIEPDPTREVKTIRAIVTWKPDVVDSGTGSADAAVTAFDCVVDVDIADFEDPDAPGTFNLPREGDQFVMIEAYMGVDRVQIARVGGDATAREYYYCVSPE